MRGLRLLPFFVISVCLADACKDEPVRNALGSLPQSYTNKAAYYYAWYMKDTAGLADFLSGELYGYIQNVKPVGCLRSGKTCDSVFVLPPLCASDTGQSYYFTDTSFPRLRTVFYCCDPEYIFPAGDIDEDGISEIGQLEFSCNSRSQRIAVWSLKSGAWRRIAECSYDMNVTDPPMNKRIRKLGKGKFEMLEMAYVSVDTTDTRGRRWKRFYF